MISAIAIAFLLLLGLGMRALVPGLGRAATPVSVIAGVVGFLIAFATDESPHFAVWRTSILSDFGDISTNAIALVFAGLLLLPQRKSASRSRDVWKQGLTAWIIILGQLGLGLIVTAIAIAPRYALPAPYGQLIEVTMAGGFGSARAMGALLASSSYNFPAGTDLLIFGATFGLIFGVVTGIPLAKLGQRRGWTSNRGKSDGPLPRGDEPARKLGVDVIDPLLLQGVFLGGALAIGIALQWGVGSLARQGDLAFQTQGQFGKHLGDLPLFFFALLGGWLVRIALHLIRCEEYLDANVIHRITGSAIDVLIVTSLARVSVTSIHAYLWPTMLLLIVGAAWSIFCLLWLSRRLLPREYWFELGLVNYGFSTAATAQGMMFLRLVDPDLKSGAAETYALAAPITAPFIGGGIITFAVLPWLIGWGGSLPVGLVAALIAIGLYVAGRRMDR